MNRELTFVDITKTLRGSMAILLSTSTDNTFAVYILHIGRDEISFQQHRNK